MNRSDSEAICPADTAGPSHQEGGDRGAASAMERRPATIGLMK